MKPSIPSNPYVYALVDPDGAVFYVGKGTGARMLAHERNARRGKPGPRHERIRSILAGGGAVAYRVLGEYDSGKAAAAAEREFIASFDGLCNLTKGGEVGGRTFDWRQKAIDRSRAHLKRLEESGLAGGLIGDVFRREIQAPSPRSIEWSPERGVVIGWRALDD